ncbi:MAG: response regulator [Acidobacteria bacterium]|nr:response regulator [Acidobacteriota bacterium]
MLKSKILIVDDTRAGRETLEELLFSPLYDLFFACNGREALEETARVTPDLILLDVMMPDMNGFEVCRKVRQDSRMGEVPIIMITALDDSESRLEGIEAGADDFISKPFDGAELRARVRTITRLNRYRRLHLERAKFEWVIERSGDGYLTVTDRGVINYANPAARLYLGLKEDLSIGGFGYFEEGLRAHHVLQPETSWKGVLDGRVPIPETPLFLIRPASQTSTALWLEVTPFDSSSAVPGERLFRLQNVSSQMSSQREMWTFYSRISFKIKTPLSSLLGNVGLLADEGRNLAPEEIEQLAMSTRNAAEKLNSEVSDILQFLRVPTLSRFGEKVTLGGLAETVRAVAEEMNVDVSVEEIPEDLKPLILSISDRGLGWVLRELFENSHKFHPHNEPHVDVVVSSTVPNWVTIQVRDNGSHLAPSQLNRALVPNYQGERYGNAMVEGMGLGLPLVASVVWEARGSCGIRNRDDAPGVIVEMSFPVQE